MRLGRGLNDPDMGPLISRQQRDDVQAYYDLARGEGEVVPGSALPSDPDLKDGHFIQPALLVGATNTARLAREEVFGPVLTVIRFDGAAEGVEIANDSPFGLVAGVHTRDVNKAMLLADRPRVGQVWVNSFFVGLDVEFPFGGFKQSGFGREKGLEALASCPSAKNICIRYPA
jgi:acyl-CoA reductase-like NAD-dependent aldehyde dehydrogenase